MSAVTTVEAVIRSVTTQQEASSVYVTKATISHPTTKPVKVFRSFVVGIDTSNFL